MSYDLFPFFLKNKAFKRAEFKQSFLFFIIQNNIKKKKRNIFK